MIINAEDRGCPVHLYRKLPEDVASILPLRGRDDVLLVTDAAVASAHLEELHGGLTRSGVRSDVLLVPAGERAKSLRVLDDIVSRLLRRGHRRDTVIVSLGGGSVGDVAGFAASVYQRGVHFVQIPTTLLSQVDACLGGKNAVNHPLGKNMIGTFHQPSAVIINLEYLRTLSRRELNSGLAEIVKYGVALDAAFFGWVERSLGLIMELDPEALLHCVDRCCRMKLQVVAADEFDRGGRQLLNLGHTYGHAIESCTRYGSWLHGEAVAAGIMVSLHVARRLNDLDLDDISRTRELLLRSNLPVSGPGNISEERCIRFMMRDKKNTGNGLSMVLPVRLGEARLYVGIDEEIVASSIRDCCRDSLSHTQGGLLFRGVSRSNGSLRDCSGSRSGGG